MAEYPEGSPAHEPARKRSRLEDDNDPVYFTLFSREDIIHRILQNGVTSPSYTGAVPPPAVGTGPNAAAISFKNFWEFMDRLAVHVRMTQACLTKRIDKQREPGVFHGVRQHIAAEFENEIDNYGWVLQGQSAGRLYMGLPTGAIQRRAGPFR